METRGEIDMLDIIAFIGCNLVFLTILHCVDTTTGLMFWFNRNSPMWVAGIMSFVILLLAFFSYFILIPLILFLSVYFGFEHLFYSNTFWGIVIACCVLINIAVWFYERRSRTKPTTANVAE